MTRSQSSDQLDINPQSTFHLIDTILPYEMCFFHQVLPLALKENDLTLAVVDEEDVSNLQIIHRHVASQKYTVKFKRIDKITHQLVLSAYQKYKNPSKPVSSIPKPSSSPINDRMTLIVDNPQEQILKDESALPDSTGESTSLLSSAQSQSAPSHPSLLDSLPKLEVHSPYLSRPMQSLGQLRPQNLVSELLGRVLIGGIGRLYFERKPNYGRIIWSQEGILKSVLEGVMLSVFQGTIDELKRMAHLPTMTIEKTKKVEIARSYHGEQVLLRLEFMRSEYGEEATVQVLRGTALQFYHQQRMDKLGQDALQLAQQLERKLKQIRARHRFTEVPVKALPEIRELLDKLQQQLDSI